MGDFFDNEIRRHQNAAERYRAEADAHRKMADTLGRAAAEQDARAAFLRGEGPAVVRER